ncbi:MAG TPA: DNA-binding protein WhiA, partial [Bacteroides sp.]|nr:DNA-binding protein WhiA [Bacteroides sp.]
MSFSSEVKEELSRHTGTARHCQIAEFAAIAGLCGRISSAGDGSVTLVISTENEIVARKCFTLLQKTFNIETKIFVRENSHLKRVKVYTIEITD